MPVPASNEPKSAHTASENIKKVEGANLGSRDGKTSFTGTLYKDATHEEVSSEIITKKAPNQEAKAEVTNLTGKEVAAGAIGCWTIILTLIGLIMLIGFAMG